MKYLNRFFWLIIFFLVTYQAIGGGFIIVTPAGQSRTGTQRYNLYSLEMRSLNTSVTINNQVAITKIDQVFYNPGSIPLQGYFLFPVPKGSVIQNFSMNVNGKQLEAELLDAKKARKMYEDIVRKMLDPALLEYAEQDLFKVRIFPIEPRKEKRIKISYSTILEKDNNTMEYIFPLNTKKFSAKPLNNVTIKINVDTQQPVKTLWSPSHLVEIIRKNDYKAVIGYETKKVKPELDFKLYIGLDNTKIGM